jgi:hypothetical protein
VEGLFRLLINTIRISNLPVGGTFFCTFCIFYCLHDVKLSGE